MDDDGELWIRVRRGDDQALAALFDRHQTRLFHHARRLLVQREDAKDAVAIALFEMWRRRDVVRLVDGSPLPWLLNTVTNTARNVDRSARRYRALLDRAPVTERAAERLRDETGVLAALGRLPEGERSVVVLTVLEGYADREVAAALGIPVGTVKSRLSRARSRLRDEMTVLEGAGA